MLLLVVEDRHAERPLRDALASAARSGTGVAVLTADPLLAMQLRREGIEARLTTDGLTRPTVDARDRVALDGVAAAFGDGSRRHYASFHGTRYGAYLEYTLIPTFVRAVRNAAAIDDALRSADRAVSLRLVGGGALVAAARLVARHRGIRTESAAGNPVQRAIQAAARLIAGRATKWVNTDFRALVLEPGFIWLLFLQGLWRRLFASAPAASDASLIVIGDRFTADVVEQLRGARRIVLAGATQPGRTMFASPDLQPIESFTEPRDLLRWSRSIVDATADTIAMWSDDDHGRSFVVAGVPCWPLVRRSVWLHVLAWTPALRHLQALVMRAAAAAPRAALLTSTDVTAYNRVVIDTLRRSGIASTGIQHGIVGQANGHDSVQVDRLAAWGIDTERKYREWRETRPRVTLRAQFIVTGNPRFDALARIVGGRPAARELRAADRPFTVTVCTGFVSDFSVLATDYENLLMLDDVIAWAHQHPGATVIHKMHPGEQLEHYAHAARTLGWDTRTLTTIREPILYDVLQRSDLMIAAYSTTILESAALGRPAIVVDTVADGGYGLLPLDAIRGISIAKSRADLHAQLTARVTGTNDSVPSPDDPALVGYIGALDGEAATRIARLIDLT
jgi:hypothetical protein